MDDDAVIDLAARAAIHFGAPLKRRVFNELDKDFQYECWALDGEPWTPLDDDGDALYLACKLGLRVDTNCPTVIGNLPGVGVWASGDNSAFPEFWTAEAKDICAATRQTILRAAAHIGKAVP